MLYALGLPFEGRLRYRGHLTEHDIFLDEKFDFCDIVVGYVSIIPNNYHLGDPPLQPLKSSLNLYVNVENTSLVQHGMAERQMVNCIYNWPIPMYFAEIPNSTYTDFDEASDSYFNVYTTEGTNISTVSLRKNSFKNDTKHSLNSSLQSILSNDVSDTIFAFLDPKQDFAALSLSCQQIKRSCDNSRSTWLNYLEKSDIGISDEKIQAKEKMISTLAPPYTNSEIAYHSRISLPPNGHKLLSLLDIPNHILHYMINSIQIQQPSRKLKAIEGRTFPEELVNETQVSTIQLHYSGAWID